ncbi:hypothetical protein [Flagellimonas eckloniae]|nr:hypothetical protein [Allomuricauda eckloniae]
MLVKVSALHVYSHTDCDEDKIESCAVCDLALETQDTGFLDVTQPVVSTQSCFTYSESCFDIVNTDFTSSLSFNLFSRPPPSLLL